MSNTTQAAVETAAAASAAKVAQTATYAGSGAAVFFGLTANELAAVGGLIVGAIGLIDALFFREPGHCEQAHLSELLRRHLPRQYRTTK